jgi:vacuolar-type H+-ATPase subunit E/Vma4
MDRKLLNQLNQENADAICAKIKEDADYETQNMLARANKEAERILKEAKELAEKKKEEILKNFDKEIEKTRERILSTINLEKKRLILEEKSKFVEEIIDMVKRKAEDFRKTQDYVDFLEKAIIEGAKVIDEGNIEIFYSFLDENIMHGGFIKKIEEVYSDNLKQECSIEIKKSDFKDPGVIVNSQDGRMMYDNRFLARLERIYDDVYMELLKEAF